MQDRTLRWLVFVVVVVVVVVQDIVATSCRERERREGVQHREREAPSAEEREVSVGQSVVVVGGC